MSDRQPSAADAFARQEWSEAHRLLRARPAEELAAPELELLAVAAYLLGRDDEALEGWERAHRRRLAAGERGAAARCSFWAAFCLMLRGQPAQADGWLQRTESTIEGLDCAAAGYVLIPALLSALASDEPSAAIELAERAAAIADRFDDRDLAALAVLGHGQALLAQGDVPGGVARLDRAMLSVRSGEAGPIVSGIVYCAVILACLELFDFARAAEWTAALEAWCAGQPDLVPYRGQCLVHRSQLQQLAGEWTTAASTVASARQRLADPPHPALGLACYQEGELFRLRGDLDAAAEAYGRASRAGYPPMPGLALLQRARGDLAGAVAGIRRALLEATEPFRRPPLLHAAVLVLAEADEVADARRCAAELADIADRSTSSALRAMADQAAGAVALSAGDLPEALPRLRSATDAWRRLGTPYEDARCSVLLGRAYGAFGDHAAAELELDHARTTFTALQARVDLDELAGRGPAGHADEVDLSARELEVLAQVADGKTNPEIARELSISPHRVSRHLENIFAKAGVSGRAAATAWAYEHDLL